MKTPISKLTALFDRKDIDAFLVTQDVNIAYLTNFPASESWLLVGRRKSFYITDFRYLHEAKKGLPKEVTVVRYSKSMATALFQLARQHKMRRIGFDERHISLAGFKRLKIQCPQGVALAAVNNLVEGLRQIKQPKEIQSVRQALAIHAQALKYLKNYIKPGASERDLLRHLEDFVKSKKVGFSFAPIIASGPNSALPHAKVTDRKILKNDIVLVDMGIDVNGYKSDLTRMFFLGKIPPLITRANDSVKTAQLKAIAKIQPKARACKIDEEARNYLEKKRLGKYFGHSLGHGVGLEIHEDPRISQTSTAVVQENMIFTVEPAVYIPGQFGIRIEDMVLVTKQGCEVLSDNIN